MNRRRLSNSTSGSLSLTTTNTNQSTMVSDQQSLISSRKASRLSNFNPMKNRSVSGKNDLSIPPNSYNAINSINASNSPYYNLTPVSTNSVPDSNNYHLTKMETNESIDSNYSLQQQFKIELNLTRKEIELIRFTWNKMLLDEPVVKSESNLAIPGGYQFQDYSLQQQASKANLQPEVKVAANNIASSLFCRQLYGNLLAMDHKLEKLFPSIKHQAVAFAGVMSFTISQLENLSALNDYLENLGKRHSRILGIEPAMFELMGEALVQTFQERFGNKFNHELEVLWIKLYMFLANSILQFGIDPVLKLNQKENRTSGSLFKVNEVNYSSSLNASLAHNSEIFSVQDERRSSISTVAPAPAPVPAQVPMCDGGKARRRKRDCVIQ